MADENARVYAQRAARHRMELRDGIVRFRDLAEDLLHFCVVDFAGLGERQLAAAAIDQAAA